jgi:magnesium transporter
MPNLPSHSSRRTGAAAPALRIPAERAVVDCAVYVDGMRLPGRYAHGAAPASCGSACTSPTNSR